MPLGEFVESVNARASPHSFCFCSSGVGRGVRLFPSSPRALSAGSLQAPPCEILHQTFHPAGNSVEAQLMVD